MSFHCENCKKVERKPIVAVIETRAKVYPARLGLVEDHEVVIDEGGEGWEIVREGLFCSQTCVSAGTTNRQYP